MYWYRLQIKCDYKKKLQRESSSSCLENLEYGVGIRPTDHATLSNRKSWH
jgi:hypothetical protein